MENRFVIDGRQRARSAAIESVRAEVMAEYRVLLEQASVWKRIWLQREIELEVKRRLGKLAPQDALY